MKKRATWVSRELVRSPIYMALCATEEQFHRELRAMKMPREEWPPFLKTRHADATVHHLENLKSGHACSIVCMRKRKRLRCEIDGLLIHEAVHIWQEVRERIGEDHPSREFEAYSIQSIAQRLIAAYHAG